MATHYQVLGLSVNATQEQIKEAYKKLAMKHHPDKGGDQSKFQEVSLVYKTLSDPFKRREYDMFMSRTIPFDKINEISMSIWKTFLLQSGLTI